MAPPLLAFEAVSLAYEGRRVVNDVSLALEPGARVAIIGPSGAGKSTVARLAVGLINPDQGVVRFDGKDLRRLSAASLRALRAGMQLMFQDSWGALDPRLSVRTSIEAPLRIHGRPHRGQAERLAEQVHLPTALLDRRPPNLSGGERQRVALARALALEPRLLVLDEPLTGLDSAVAAALRTEITDVQSRLQTATLWITHDLREVDTVADTVAVMDGGRRVEFGPVSRILADPRHPTTRALLASTKDQVRSGEQRSTRYLTQGPSR